MEFPSCNASAALLDLRLAPGLRLTGMVNPALCLRIMPAYALMCVWLVSIAERQSRALHFIAISGRKNSDRQIADDAASCRKLRGLMTFLRKLITRRLGQSGAFALEFALVAPVFMVMLFVVFEISYDEFMQEVLDNALQSAARQVQIGDTQSASTSTFVTDYFCPYGSGLLNCKNLFVRIQSISFSAGSCSNLSSSSATGDFYDATVSGAPVSSGVLELGDFYSGAGTVGSGSDDNLSSCASSSSSAGYCNAGPQELILMTGIYVAPSFLDGLVLNHITYGGNYVRALYSTASFETEPFSNDSPSSAC
jgi:hypothetical protein